MVQVHKNFTDEQVKNLLERYLKHEIERKYIQEILDNEAEQALIKELKIEKQLIDNKDIPIRKYNYSYIKDLLEVAYQQKVSLTTIIKRAKQNDFYLPKKLKKTIHDRKVLTNYVGELIQHDSSFHLWSLSAKEKWYLVTSLDDFSRLIFYATFLKKETSWDHILALQTVILNYGLPLSYYVDSHSIFRFVQERDLNMEKPSKTY